MKKYFFLLFLFCGLHSVTPLRANAVTNFSFNKTTNENPIKKIVRKIAKSGFYDAAAPMGNRKAISEQETLYKDLLNTATTEQLTELAAHNKNAVVRLYAFRALMEKVKDAPKNIFEQFAGDTTPIKVVNGNKTEMKPLNSIANGFLY